uniref:Uncharacterized protein n=1 Tax=Triticum urartu TaxID=4572 RepID=A0A8R7UAT7_TRIUA
MTSLAEGFVKYGIFVGGFSGKDRIGGHLIGSDNFIKFLLISSGLIERGGGSDFLLEHERFYCRPFGCWGGGDDRVKGLLDG